MEHIAGKKTGRAETLPRRSLPSLVDA